MRVVTDSANVKVHRTGPKPGEPQTSAENTTSFLRVILMSHRTFSDDPRSFAEQNTTTANPPRASVLESFLTVHYFGAASLLGGAKRGQIDGHVVADFYNTVSNLEAWRHAWRTRHADWLLEHNTTIGTNQTSPNDPRRSCGYFSGVRLPQGSERIFLRCQLHQTTLRVSQDWTPRKPKRHPRLQLWLKYRDCDCGSEPGIPNLTFVAF